MKGFSAGLVPGSVVIPGTKTVVRLELIAGRECRYNEEMGRLDWDYWYWAEQATSATGFDPSELPDRAMHLRLLVAQNKVLTGNVIGVSFNEHGRVRHATFFRRPRPTL